MSGLLIIMAKQPSPGAVKTRLSPPLRLHDSLALYSAFLRDTISLVDATCGLAGNITPAIAYTPADAEGYFRALAPDRFVLLPQIGADLGERLRNLPAQAGELGYSPVAMISSDSPTLPASVVVQCFTELRRSEVDAVLGPCDDGGYYLIGMKRPQPALFAGIDWSTRRVTSQTLRAADAEGLRMSLLPTWPDVDTADDLRRLWANLRGNRDAAPHTYDVLMAIGVESSMFKVQSTTAQI
jgi:rSAM/selenodomain-associated transferase 1